MSDSWRDREFDYCGNCSRLLTLINRPFGYCCERGIEVETMKVSNMFPGNYLKASDLNGKQVTVIIENVREEDIGEETKPVMHFAGKDRGLVLNRTNANMVAEILGSEETDEWEGHQIVLYPSKTDFKGKRVDCIRVDAPKVKVPPAPPKPEPPKPEAKDADDDEPPF